MSGKKKVQKQKMSLSDFLADESSGSWADEMTDLPSAPSGVPREDNGAFGGSGRFERHDELPRGPSRNREERHEGGFRDRNEGGFRDRNEGGFRDRGEGGFRDRNEGRERSFPPRSPAVLPTEPPFTAHVANLSFEVNEEDLTEFFANLKIAHIRILRDRESERSKGYGYIEFEDLESLKAALELSGEPLQNRAVRVNIADPPKERTDRPERREDRTNVGTWRREGPVVLPERERPERQERQGGFRDRQQQHQHERTERTFADRRSDTSWSGGAFANNRRQRDAPAPAAERPRLNLLPRSVGNKSDDATKSSKSNPFGGAKPVDTNKALERVEDKIQHLKVDDEKKD